MPNKRRYDNFCSRVDKDWILLGISAYHFHIGQFERAFKEIKSLLQSSPDSAEAHFWCGKIAIKCLQKEIAESHLKKAIALKPENCDAIIELGILYREVGRVKSALSTFEKALSDPMFFTTASKEIGYTHRIAGNMECAIRHLKNATMHDIGTACIQIEMGLLYRDSGRYDAALTHFEAAKTIEPTNDNAFLNIGHVYRIIGNYRKAREHYSAALRLNPDNPHTWLEIGIVFRNEGDKGRARDYFYKALGINNDVSATHFYIGRLLRMSNDFEDSLSHLNIASDLDTSNIWIYYEIGLIQAVCGETQKAMDAFNKLLSINPFTDVVYRYMGAEYRRIDAIFENGGMNGKCRNILPQLSIGQLLFAKGKINVALKYFNRMETTFQLGSIALHYAGIIQRLLKNHEASKILLEKAIQKNPANKWPLLDRGLISLHEGRIKDAFSDLAAADNAIRYF